MSARPVLRIVRNEPIKRPVIGKNTCADCGTDEIGPRAERCGPCRSARTYAINQGSAWVVGRRGRLDKWRDRLDKNFDPKGRPR